ncbi:HAMP domain-containing sensor histidine kinase [Hydrogenophaga sp. MI9]|uniref:HAMP domain-containing sensor histidine kinase n=1 Tax=Hydrogenophaga sp. MI9 TaxID=3453719 RepID=UPI003EEFC4DF
MRSENKSAWRRAKHRVAHSIKLRMVLVFLVLAAALSFVFFTGAQKAFTMGWRDAARPILMDYVDRLTLEVTGGGAPSVERARAITQRLPLTVRISGPVVNWASHPDQGPPDWIRARSSDAPSVGQDWGNGKDWPRILHRQTADGHTIEFGINGDAFEHRPRMIGYLLCALLLLTLLAWLYVRRLLKPLDAIGEGARRFGAGDFSLPIPERCVHGPDELGELALTINTMGRDIHQMLEAKRALLLAISHELRSPLTRARLNAELLPESAEVNPQRDALLRDLQEMATLITDLLESERLAGHHAALQREPTDLAALARSVVQDLGARHAGAAQVTVEAPADLPRVAIDPARVRLLIRNLLDNALRHGAGAPQAPVVRLSVDAAGALHIGVRDHGPGVPDDQIEQLAQAFYRPDSARTRSAGGVGLGLYLCRLVARAHGGSFEVRNAQPGLQVTVTLPPA